MEKRSRHPEVHQESPSRLEPNNQILAATIDQRDTLAGELSCHLGRVEGPRQPRIGDRNLGERATLEERREPAPDGLHLGQLGHRRTVASGS